MIEITKGHDLPPALAKLASGRDYIKTSEFAKAFSRAAQTVRKRYSQSGECFGIKPRKVGNFLLWSVRDIAAILQSGVTK